MDNSLTPKAHSVYMHVRDFGGQSPGIIKIVQANNTSSSSR